MHENVTIIILFQSLEKNIPFEMIKLVTSLHTLQPKGRIISSMLLYNMLYKLFQCNVGSVYGVACKKGVRVAYTLSNIGSLEGALEYYYFMQPLGNPYSSPGVAW